MSQGDQTPPNDAREASMARVTTLADLVKPDTQPPTKVEEPSKGEPDNKGTDKPKNRFQERISEVISQRNAAEEEAAKAKREADELRAQLESLRVQAEPVKQGDKPVRSTFGSDDDYVEALTDWKAMQAVAKREDEQAQARAKAEFDQVTRAWEKRVEEASAEIDDFAEVIQASEVNVPDYVSQAILRSKQGPLLAYFLAKHPDEARKVSRMHPIDAVGYLKDLERDFKQSPPTSEGKPVERSKAPEPIKPVRQAAAMDPGPATNFAEYRARRKAKNPS